MIAIAVQIELAVSWNPPYYDSIKVAAPHYTARHVVALVRAAYDRKDM